MKKIFIVMSALLLSAAVGWAAIVSQRETPVVKAIRAAAPSVVNISTEQIVYLAQQPFWGPYGNLYDTFFNQHARAVGAMKLPSLGSGVVVAKNGLIVTNAHVVQMANKIIVTLHDGTTAEATVIGLSQKDDLALIQIPVKKPLKALPMARDVMIGETVVTIGNPLGLQNSVSAGIVSGTKRSFTTQPASHVFTDLIQTDASIGPGSSGGALVNLDSELVGINLAVVQEAPSIGFAIPVAKVQAMLEEYERLRKENKVIVVR